MNDFKPMRSTDSDVANIKHYLQHPAWALEQKFDGARVYIKATRGVGAEFLASNGAPIKFSAAKLKLPALEEELMEAMEREALDYVEIDGELIVETGELYLFDLTKYRWMHDDTEVDFIASGEAYLERKEKLDELFGYWWNEEKPGLIDTVYTAKTTVEKRALWEKIEAGNVEGGILKHMEGAYVPGTRSKTQLKMKLVKTADVIVVNTERRFKDNGVVSHGKAQLAVYRGDRLDPQGYVNDKGKRVSPDELLDMGNARQASFRREDREIIPIGNASLIGKDLTIGPGDVVEVAYLYFQDAMIQPRIIRKRDPEEKVAEQCFLDQFPVYSRKNVSQ